MLAPGMPGISKLGMPPLGIGKVQLDLLVVQFAVAEPRAEILPRLRTRVLADQRIQNPVLGIELGLGLDLLAALLAHHEDRDLQEIADDLLDIAADIADLGELGRLDLHEGRVGELGETARDFRLADAGRPDHQDILRQHLLAHGFGELLAAPAVAERDGDGALGVLLADDMTVEFGNDLAGENALIRCPAIRA